MYILLYTMIIYLDIKKQHPWFIVTNWNRDSSHYINWCAVVISYPGSYVLLYLCTVKINSLAVKVTNRGFGHVPTVVLLKSFLFCFNTHTCIYSQNGIFYLKKTIIQFHFFRKVTSNTDEKHVIKTKTDIKAITMAWIVIRNKPNTKQRGQPRWLFGYCSHTQRRDFHSIQVSFLPVTLM